MSDLSKLTEADLQAIRDGNWTAVSDDGIKALAGDKFDSSKVETPGYLDGIMRSIAQGFTFGYADEFSAAVNAPFSDKTYSELRKEESDKNKAFGEKAPVTQIAGEVGGGVAQTALVGPFVQGAALLPKVGGAIKTGAEAVTKYVGSKPKIVQNAIQGGAQGALSGSGAAEEGSVARGEGAVEGGMWGAVLSTVLPTGISATSKVLGRLWDATGIPDATKKALDRIIRNMDRDEISARDLMDEINRMQGMGAPAALADAGGENLLGLADTVANLPGKARNQARRIIEERHDRQINRVEEAIQDGLTPNKDFRGTIKGIVERRKTASKAAYDKAYQFGDITDVGNITARNQNIDDATAGQLLDQLNGLVGRPSFGKALSWARRIAADEGESLPITVKRDNDGNVVGITGLDTRHVDYIKRGFDKVIEDNSAENPLGKPTVNTVGRGVLKLQKEFLDIVDEINPDFKEARRAFSMPSGSLGALKDGEEFMKMDPAELKEQFSTLSDADKEYFRAGVSHWLRTQMAEARDGSDVIKRVWKSPAMRERLELVFPSPDAFQRYASKMDAEERMFRTRDVFGNSATARREAQKEDLDAGENFMRHLLTTMDPVGGVRNAVGGVMARAQGLPPNVVDELGPMLFDPTKARGVLSVLAQRQRERQDILRKFGVANRLGVGALSTVSGLESQ